jgi:hypothetical protein
MASLERGQRRARRGCARKELLMKEKEWDEMLAVQRAAYLKSSRD